MPRDKGGIGRTGNKHKKKTVAEPRNTRAGATSRTAAAPAATTAPATNTKEQEEPAAAAAAEPETETCRPATRTRIRKVRFVVDQPPRARRPPYEWTWGRKGRLNVDWTRSNGRPEYRPIMLARDELRAHLWGLRVAEHVAAGCVGEWVHSYAHDMAWVQRASHRRWCPDELPDPVLRRGRWVCDGAEYPCGREMFYRASG